jgi:DNA-binding GntR family transcriptional regulator
MDRIRSHFAIFGLAAISHEGRVQEILREHHAVILALHDGNKKKAAAAMRDHLVITEKYVLGKV